MAVVVAIPLLALPGLLLGLALLAADRCMPKHRSVWIAAEFGLVGVMIVLGLWLGENADF
ncbi:MAG: hypothetical protein AAF790_00755 [Planctomycetota bacterium]